MLGGRPANVWLNDDWLEARMPACGKTGDLLVRQADVAGLAKVAAGGYLRAELPLARRSLCQSFTVLRMELEKSLDFFEGNPGGPRAEGTELSLSDCLAATDLEWSAKEDKFCTRLEEDDPFTNHVATASLAGSALLLRTTLARVRNAGPASLCALSHFLLALNGHIRLARGSLGPDKAWLEVVLPADWATAELVHHAVRSLAVGSRAARRECAALLEPEMAQMYLEFHLKGEKQ